MDCDCINCQLARSTARLITSAAKDADEFDVDPIAHLIMASVALAHHSGISPDDYARICLMHFNGYVEITDEEGIPEPMLNAMNELRPKQHGPVMLVIVRGGDGEPAEDEAPPGFHRC